jgi:hypothetical protein
MRPLFTKQTICILAILLGGSLEATTVKAQDREPSIAAPGPSADTGADIAAGAAEDTLDACRARIPKDASIGQVMMAEQSCWRDENERKPVQAVPRARRTSSQNGR